MSYLIIVTSKSLALSKVPLMMLFRCLSKLCAVITILSFFCPFVICSNFLSGIHLVFRIMRIAAYSSRAPVMRYRIEEMALLKLLTEHQEDADDQVQVYRIQTRGSGGILSGENIKSLQQLKIFHVSYLTLLNILIKTRKRVTRRAILGL